MHCILVKYGGIFLKNCGIFANTVVFWANTVVFWANTVVFWALIIDNIFLLLRGTHGTLVVRGYKKRSSGYF